MKTNRPDRGAHAAKAASAIFAFALEIPLLGPVVAPVAAAAAYASAFAFPEPSQHDHRAPHDTGPVRQ